MRWFFGGLALLFGIGFSLFAVVTFFTGVESEGWPAVDGSMVVSEVDIRRESRSGGLPDKKTYVPRVEYEYVVEGESYRGHRFELVERGRQDRSSVERDLRGFEVGETVPVRFDPGNPAASVLRVGVPSAMGVMLLFGAAFVLIGVLVIQCFGPKQQPYRRGSRRRASETG